MRKIVLIPFFLLMAASTETFAATTLPPTAPPSYGYEGLGPLPSQGPNRLYWNTIQEPRSLEMRGATWKDPALVPQLPNASLKHKTPKAGGKTVKRAVSAKRRTGTTARKPVKKAPASTIPPLTAPDAHDEDLARRPVQQFDPFADSRPMPPERLQ